MTLSAWVRACSLAAVMLGLALPAAAAQRTVRTQGARTATATEIQRLQDQVNEVSDDISSLQRNNNSNASADRLQNELDEIGDEVIYLKVKLRKEGSVSRTVYIEVRDRLQDLRTRAHNEVTNARPERGTYGSNSGGTGTSGGYGTGTGTGTGSSSGIGGGVIGGSGTGSGTAAGTGGVGDGPWRPNPTTSGNRNDSGIPSGQEIDVRLETELSSDTAQPEQRFEATTAADLYRGNDVLIPAGSTLRGVVSSVNKATRTDRKGSMTVAFDQITVRGRSYPMRGTVTQAIESEGIKGEATKIGAGAGVGAIIGGILGGLKGAVLGTIVGGGGTIAATEGKDVTLPTGTILRVRLDTPPTIR